MLSKVMFVDESGDHSLLKIDFSYPVFVLAGVIMAADFATNELPKMVRAFKERFFGRSDFRLRTADIRRNRGIFSELKDPCKRQAFFDALTEFIETLPFSVVACGIRKQDHVKQYGDIAMDPYQLSLTVLVERFCFDLGYGNRGTIVAESRGSHLDKVIRSVFEQIRLRGTRYISPTTVRRVASLTIQTKNDAHSGLELADLVASPIARHVMGKPARPDFLVVERKFRRGPHGEVQGYGLVVLPKN